VAVTAPAAAATTRAIGAPALLPRALTGLRYREFALSLVVVMSLIFAVVQLWLAFIPAK
jgi:hypothetical protein